MFRGAYGESSLEGIYTGYTDKLLLQQHCLSCKLQPWTYIPIEIKQQEKICCYPDKPYVKTNEGCLVAKWLKHWTADLEVSGSSPTREQGSFIQESTQLCPKYEQVYS